MNHRKILIATDGSEYSYFAARKSYELFQAWADEVAFVFVMDAFQMTGNPEAGVMPQDAALVIKKEAEIALQACTKVWDTKKTTIFMPQGRPVEEILQTAAAYEADLIILGTHGRTGIRHLLMGSIAEAVLKKSPVPVMIVPMR